jgi:DNA-binding NarL/FixJ family response regulator
VPKKVHHPLAKSHSFDAILVALALAAQPPGGTLTADQTISVSIVAENRLLREALARILRKKQGFEVRAVFPSLPDLSSMQFRSIDDVLILDPLAASLPNCALISEIAKGCQAVRILLIDMEADREVFLGCVRAGVAGYLLKDASAAEVIAAVRTIAQGHAVCPEQLCMTLFKTVARSEIPSPSGRTKAGLSLTRRQRQLIPLIERGLTNKEIACQLNISEQTVKKHVHLMLRRTGANGRLAVADLAQQYPPHRADTVLQT